MSILDSTKNRLRSTFIYKPFLAKKGKKQERQYTEISEEYYKKLLESLRFFQGDEGTIRELVRAEIDRKIF